MSAFPNIQLKQIKAEIQIKGSLPLQKAENNMKA